MRQFLNRWGSTLIVWSFLVTTVTGVLLFFHVHAGPTEVLHIWIGFLMVAAFVPHVARNWRAFLGYFRKTPTYVALALTVVISAALSYPALTGSGAQGGPPGVRSMAAISSAVTEAPISAIAPIIGTDAAGVIAKLYALGIDAAGPEATLKDVADAAGKSANDLLASLISAAPAAE